MNTVKTLHRNAMQALDSALQADIRGEKAEALDFRLEAFRLEKEAADLVLTLPNSEPSRSIIAKSAATIALSCGLNDEAEQMAFRTLALSPPETIADDLRDLLEQAWAMRHLELRGIELSSDELQLSLAGRGVGFGFAPTGEVVQRLNATNLLMFRTAERHLHKPYRDAGPPTDFIRSIAQQYISVPRAASFAVTIRIGRGEQPGLPGISNAEAVIDDLLDCLELFNTGASGELASRVGNSSYLRNFVALAQGIAPDGDTIKTVGFTAVRPGGIRQVALSRTWDEVKDFAITDGLEGESYDSGPTVDVTGWLRFADSLHKNGKIKIQSEAHTTTITVPEGMMNDVIQPHWNHWVTARVRKSGRTLLLEAVRPTAL